VVTKSEAAGRRPGVLTSLADQRAVAAAEQVALNGFELSSP